MDFYVAMKIFINKLIYKFDEAQILRMHIIRKNIDIKYPK